MMRPWFLLLSSLVFAPQSSWAAACCGGGFAAPSIIAGDEKAQLTTSYSYTDVVIDYVDSRGIWRQWDEHQKVQTLKIEGAHVIADRWQAGFRLPILQRSRINESHSGLGDLSFSFGYEYLPDWSYNPIRPKGIGYLHLTLPTGKSRAESEIGGLDCFGNGFWAIGIGTLLTKTLGRYDTFGSIEVHRSLPKAVSTRQVQGTLEPGFGGQFGLGAGYNLRSFRIGGSVTWIYEDPVKIHGPSPSNGLPERYATAVISLSFLASQEWAGTLSYTDQTVFGDPINTSLGRTVAFQLQRRWNR